MSPEEYEAWLLRGRVERAREIAAYIEAGKPVSTFGLEEVARLLRELSSIADERVRAIYSELED